MSEKFKSILHCHSWHALSLCSKSLNTVLMKITKSPIYTNFAEVGAIASGVLCIYSLIHFNSNASKLFISPGQNVMT